ncbi:IclR family transcriptional regulator [Rubrobacter aplysinae]|uniref:IclR family transcriptional regulator n=1 Tax=Rubrobacter aplysinae TaxID=909625 RepID=UPI00064BA8D5|nr:IclR family transcriptional regulator [Rubrobacter aplysinae]
MSESTDNGLSEQRPGGVQSLERALDILEVLGRSDEELGVSEIGEEAGLANGTVHRLLATLTYRGYARQNPRGRKYTLGVKTLILASSARERLGPFSQPFLRELMEASGESSNLATLDKTSVIYLEQAPSPRMVRMFTEPGNRVSPHSSGTGKVLLAYQPPHVVDSILRQTELPRFTRYTITDPATLKEELHLIREQGYALDSEEMEEGVRCLAAPIFGPDGSIVAGISLSGPVGRLGDTRLEELIPLIKRIAREFSESLSQTLST